MSCVQLEGILFPIMQRMISQDGQDVFEEVHTVHSECSVLHQHSCCQVPAHASYSEGSMSSCALDLF